MFQTFSGSSRRPRQVNLSGQNLNPFAASSWTPNASGTQQTVAHAQQERLLRQQERERLNASKSIQKTWRGHKVRKKLADERRTAWDEAGRNSNYSDGDLISQLQLLLAFFTSRRPDDIGRLTSLSSDIYLLGYQSFLARPEVEQQLGRLAHITLEALHT